MFYLVEKTALLPKAQLPKVMVTCGTEDFLYSHNTRFRDTIQALPYKFTYREWPGTHEWGFWIGPCNMRWNFSFPAAGKLCGPPKGADAFGHFTQKGICLYDKN